MEMNQSGLPSSPVVPVEIVGGSKKSFFKDRKDLQRLAREDIDKNFKVVIRVRPPLPRELEGDLGFVNCVKVDGLNRSATISENISAAEAADGYDGVYATHSYTFDHCYDQDNDQKSVYENTARSAVISTLQGYNATIIAYGQTGTGKTYTMEGFNNERDRGIIPRSIEEIFNYIQACGSEQAKFLVRASYLQIYNEVISDLLKPERNHLAIREDRKKGVYVEGLSEWVVRSPAEIYGLMQRGATVRATGATRMNAVSSRSHAVFIIIVEQSTITANANDEEEEQRLLNLWADYENKIKRDKLATPDETTAKILRENIRQQFRIGKLNLVDLAGSERVRLTGATGKRLEESRKINQSLSALGNVIAALTDPKGRTHIPYRDSKLTRILEDSLGGNCKTTMMAMISPAMEAFSESLSTLKFANRAKNIKNEARVNEDLDQKALLRKYERELRRLRQELEEKSKNVVDKRKLLEVEEQARQAEQDKLAAIMALEKRSREFMMEKAEKRKLEERIQSMQSQLLGGSTSGVQDTAAFRTALQQEHSRIRQEYEAKVVELERERQNIEEDKAQVDRYKQLLLKQRDIMIALTARLNERDETILALQEEVDAYDRHQRMLEDTLDMKSAALIHLQRISMEQYAESPVRNPQLEEALGEDDLRSAMPYRGGEGVHFTKAPSSYGVAEKKYAPFMDNVVFDMNDLEAPALLTAEEKVQELQAILESRIKETESAQSSLEEVTAEKVSLESLLHEKLEKFVASEIEDRLRAYKEEVERWKMTHADGGKRLASQALIDLARTDPHSSRFADRIADLVVQERELIEAPLLLKLRELESQGRASASYGNDTEDGEQSSALRMRLQSAEAESKMLRRKLEGLQAIPGSANSNSGSNQEEVHRLRQQLNASAKERVALKTILESKIKMLVDSIANVSGTSNPGVPERGRLQRDVQALQKLVNASVAALNNVNQEVATHRNEKNKTGLSALDSSRSFSTESTSLPSDSISARSGNPKGKNYHSSVVENLLAQRLENRKQQQSYSTSRY